MPDPLPVDGVIRNELARDHLPALIKAAATSPPRLIGPWGKPAAAITVPSHALPAEVMTALLRALGDVAGFELAGAGGLEDMARQADQPGAAFPAVPGDVLTVIRHLWSTDTTGESLAELVTFTTDALAVESPLSSSQARRLVVGAFATNLQVRRSEFTQRVDSPS